MKKANRDAEAGNKQPLYCAIIGDVVRSRQVSDRAAVQEKLKAALDHVNQKYAESIASRFIITLGDEFQGLLKPSDQCYNIIINIVEALEPVRIRFGIGYGAVHTAINEVALGMDGPAFHSARRALEDARKLKEHAVVFSGTLKDPELLALNTVFTLLAQVRNLWTDRQKKVAKLSRSGLTQEEIAKRLEVKQPNVSQLYTKGRIEQVLKAEKNLESLLRYFLDLEQSNPYIRK